MRSLRKILMHILLIDIIIDIFKSSQPFFAKSLSLEVRFSFFVYYVFIAQSWSRFDLELYIFLTSQPFFVKSLFLEARFSFFVYYIFIAQNWSRFDLELYVLKRWEQLESHDCTSESRRSRVALTESVNWTFSWLLSSSLSSLFSSKLDFSSSSTNRSELIALWTRTVCAQTMKTALKSRLYFWIAKIASSSYWLCVIRSRVAIRKRSLRKTSRKHLLNDRGFFNALAEKGVEDAPTKW